MRNFLFRGNAGTGKTMGAQAIAAGLNLPYTLMTCSANTEITDLVGQFIPDTSGFQGEQQYEGELPKISDIIMHPPSVYKMLTGVYDEEKTEDDVLQKLIEIAVGNLVEKEETPGQRIRYVDTPLVEAIRYCDFDTYDKNNRYRLMDMSARDCNRDGAALRFVAEKLSKQVSEVKILIIICDGQPNDDGYSGSSAEADLRGIKLEYARKGVQIYAAAIGEDRQRIERIYGDGYLDITDLNDLPILLTSLIARNLPH